MEFDDFKKMLASSELMNMMEPVLVEKIKSAYLPPSSALTSPVTPKQQQKLQQPIQKNKLNQFILKENKIPFAPAKVELSHMHENGKLLSDAEIKEVIANFEKTENKNVNRLKINSSTGVRYTVIKLNDPSHKTPKYYAIYLGVKRKEYGEFGKALGGGYIWQSETNARFTTSHG